MTDNVDDFLAHHGVKGMKWGVRRENRAAQKAATKKARKDILRGKSLDERVARSRKEKELKKLLNDDLMPKRMATKRFVDDFLKDNNTTVAAVALTAASTAAGVAFMAYRMNKSLSGISLSPIPLR